MTHADAMTLVAAIVVRAIRDINLPDECPHVGGHRVSSCSRKLLEELRLFANDEAPVNADELLHEFYKTYAPLVSTDG